MNINSIESSLYKLLYDTFEATDGIRIFENVYYVDFKNHDQWIVIDSQTNTAGAIPKATFNLHISIKNGLMNEKVVLNKLLDKVLKVMTPGYRFDVLDGDTADLIGEAEITETSLLPVMQHQGGGSFRSLTIGVVYAGEIPA
ncbi:hypothetical protein [Geobacter sp. SVR]|uniref:hypothetical protein n=1 Tax=Geobacter sp. SVR TaxID=2495594 RepID=UPI00143EFB63|nr:hypothetical protein [Geobacter sp. SVR]BCS54035.1 hypothetical protein GSVR_23430 [Geobacter sp. SVR]GCF86184.1 hypothetical protein GSbR_27840 [Geobacter sp. SVR]